MIINDEEKQLLIIRRLYCEECKRIHHELPDCVVPYKRYCARIIEKAIISEENYIPCPEDTIRRIRKWWTAVVYYFLRIIETLKVKFKARFSEPPAFRETARAAANSNNWVFAHKVCTRSVTRPD